MTALAQTGSAGSWPQTSGVECVCVGVRRLSGFWLHLKVEACWNQGNICADAKCGHLYINFRGKITVVRQICIFYDNNAMNTSSAGSFISLFS